MKLIRYSGVMTRRYFCPQIPTDGGIVQLPESEIQHARVMRIAPGDTVQIFDGRGNEASAVVVESSRKSLVCQATEPKQVDRESSTQLHLAIALPKPDRAREMIERLTELGTAELTPLIAERTQRSPSDSLLQKLARGVVEACKQSERNVLMKINSPVSSEEFFRQSQSANSARFIAHPLPGQSGIPSRDSTAPVVVALGPEGGWTDTEVQLAMGTDFQAIGLGPRILRIETAAAVVAAKLLL